MSRLTIGSLFSGIGGLELGLEWAGVGESVWQVEQNEFARAVLAKHWPRADRSVTDVCAAGAHNLKPVDVICGGFPCQDVSVANQNGLGLDGERSGLWREYARIIRELRPRYVVVENVANLLVRGMERVLGDLAALGYDAEWRVLSAAGRGAPHLRERVWILAHPRGVRVEGLWGAGENAGGAGSRWPDRSAFLRTVNAAPLEPGACWPQPLFRRVDDGGRPRMDIARIHALGNAVVPQVAEVVGRVILALEAERTA